MTGYEKALVFEAWTSYFRVDTGDSILETNEGNNLSGPHDILWRFPQQPGWPVAIGSDSIPRPRSRASTPTRATLETIIGCDDGKLYVLKSDGTELPGWPVTIGDTLFSSPAVADIAGDYHKEVVIGGKDGKIYAYDYLGAKLWEYATGSAVYRDAGARRSRPGRQVRGALRARAATSTRSREMGAPLAGSWPYSAGAGTFTSPAVGDVDGDGALEIAAIAYGYTAPVRIARVSPQAGRNALTAAPGRSSSIRSSSPIPCSEMSYRPTSDLEIVAGAVNGEVYVWKIERHGCGRRCPG